MKFNTALRIFFNTVVCLFLFSDILNCQTYSFRNYGAEYNIPDGFIYTINQADNGFLWVGTGSGLARFDGFNYFPVAYPDHTTGRNSTVSFKAKNGSIWFGCSDGTVFYTKGNSLVSANIINSRSISQILEAPDGRIFIIPQGKFIFAIDPAKPEEVSQYPLSQADHLMFSAVFAQSGDLLIGTQGNILICSMLKDVVTVKSTIEGFDYSGVTSIITTKDSTRFIVGTADNGLFQLRVTARGSELSRIKGHPEWSALKVKSILSDRDNNFWVSTFENGVIQIRLSDNFEATGSERYFNKNTGLSSDDVSVVFQDSEGNFWFGLFGEGVSILTSYSLGYFTAGGNSDENNIIYIKSLKDKYLLGTPSGYHLFDAVSGKFKSYTNLSGLLGKSPVSSYYLDKENNLWIGTAGKGLYVRNASGNVSLFYRSGDSGIDQIHDIVIDGSNVWIGTTNGVVVLDRKTKKLKNRIDNSSGVLTNNFINKILINRKGYAIIGTQSDMLFQVDNEFRVSSGSGQMGGSTINKVISFSETRTGEIWVATSGNGIFGCKNDSVTAVNRLNGLFSNYCYSILADSEGNVWIGHAKGFSKFNPKTGVMVVYGTDYARSGTCNTNAIYESVDGKIFIGTTEGLIVYDRKKEKKSIVPPYTNINSIVVGDSVYAFQPVITLPYKKYRVTVNFAGISFSSPDKVWYQTYLDNYDPGPSKMMTSREVSYTLTDGKYKFLLTSVNDKGLSQEPALSFDIIISKPWWRTWWSLLTGLIILTSIVVLIIRARDKAQKKVQLYLETELDARTSVVMKQKGEIELQNIEITDSINYAKRIQTSILPDINKLKEAFKDAFILFHPRDIVSGDFYWFDKLKDDRFILVCADSTGHGVPGAFMSMIGSTLLQDIVTRKGITKPSEILTLLDKQIFSTLNQNVELGVSNDGMDMVVCEFNVKTRHIRFASAMRPVIIVMGGESYYIKGNRSSIGGESVIEKYFDDQEYYLGEGDTVYLFSDGLPDQFGGADGKKMKIARLKRIIEQISKLPMDEQKEAMAKYYFDWKGSYDQVDDVLLMAVRV